MMGSRYIKTEGIKKNDRTKKKYWTKKTIVHCTVLLLEVLPGKADDSSLHRTESFHFPC